MPIDPSAPGLTPEEARKLLARNPDFQPFLDAAHAVGPNRQLKFPNLAAYCDAMLDPNNPQGAQSLVRLADGVSCTPDWLKMLTNSLNQKSRDINADPADMLNNQGRLLHSIATTDVPLNQSFNNHSSLLGGMNPHPGGQNFMQIFIQWVETVFSGAVHNELMPGIDSLFGTPTMAGERSTTPANRGLRS